MVSLTSAVLAFSAMAKSDTSPGTSSGQMMEVPYAAEYYFYRGRD